MALLARQATVAQRALCSSQFKQAPLARSVRCKSYVPLELIAAGKRKCRALVVLLVAEQLSKLFFIFLSPIAGLCSALEQPKQALR
jgi:hypothetical protein